MGGGCLGGIVGAVLGILIGGAIGQQAWELDDDIKHNRNPIAEGYSLFTTLFNPCLGFMGMLVGAGIGGTIGGIGGSSIGAAVAASKEEKSSGESNQATASPSSDKLSDSEILGLKSQIPTTDEKKEEGSEPPEP